VSTHHALISVSVTAREYGPGLGYPPVETFVLASLGVACCALIVYGYFAIKFSWWPLRTKRSHRADSSEPGNRDT
jgi:hypothetical protein